jgi:hypothetical protein
MAAHQAHTRTHACTRRLWSPHKHACTRMHTHAGAGVRAWRRAGCGCGPISAALPLLGAGVRPIRAPGQRALGVRPRRAPGHWLSRGRWCGRPGPAVQPGRTPGRGVARHSGLTAAANGDVACENAVAIAAAGAIPLLRPELKGAWSLCVVGVEATGGRRSARTTWCMHALSTRPVCVWAVPTRIGLRPRCLTDVGGLFQRDPPRTRVAPYAIRRAPWLVCRMDRMGLIRGSYGGETPLR